ncbi:hypothetical protein NLI96_g4207 [Meripilus lineatus]|uniref:Cytokinin riboside 5'-monophosphate phosphoribohydrolase n=1 Tax=Meripilus lineatus TaxID=2056292 RepID=A0AAD5VAN8_9APHY|nr:hypothetical protein NLI96_g4207 [Physisporinus lineatus]
MEHRETPHSLPNFPLNLIIKKGHMGSVLSCLRKPPNPYELTPISLPVPTISTSELHLPHNMTREDSQASTAVAVYCASSFGEQEAFRHAARSLGKGLADAERPLVYGGGSKGIMGLVSGAALAAGGKVTGVVPFAMVAAGGEQEQKAKATLSALVALDEKGRENVHTVVVDSMHERKMEMARRSCGFVALPGGFGTFEEVR